MKFQNNSFENARRTHRKVSPEEIDVLGHVNNAEYVKWIQDAATEHWHAVTKTEPVSDYAWFCVRHEIDYKQQLYENQSVEVRTWLGQMKGARFDRHVDIREAGSDKPAVIAKTTWVLINKVSGLPVRIKNDILSLFI